MAAAYPTKRVVVFEELRRRLFGIAYRMIGTTADAEDIVQEAYLRWHQADTEEIRSAEAWLVSVVTRLSIDKLRKASVEREKYIGPWLPEPLIASTSPSPEEKLETASNLSMAFMVLLERLTPVERAAFLLHDVFDCAYPLIANILRKSEAACRQVVHRARERVRSEQARFKATDAARRSLINQFIAAADAGDDNTLLSLFAKDATLTSDGGGVVPAARKVVHGRSRIARLYLLLAKKLGTRLRKEIVTINGEPGLVMYLDGAPFATVSFATDETSITALYTVLNPQKLRF
ncbi:MAG TPA: RNA polymerase sigma-70 factor [Pyrinomonadaceae bacterium]|nr:RNA polymerase sigma-70 factor [Pyrinomonadaceae bacterium]